RGAALVGREFDRPLSRRGRRAASAVGKAVKALGLGFDRTVASPARRVIETLDEVASTYGSLTPEYEQRVYLATPDSLLDIVHETGDGVARLLLVGHNPGMENLALLLTRGGDGGLRGEVEVKYPTATLAE